jgi:predicted DsbA family dithiol-disulfide isomerase
VRIEKLRKNFNLQIELVHFPLHPDTPNEGRSMAELYAGRGADPDALWRQMKERMDLEGLPYGKRTHTFNSRKAQELGKWADTQENGDQIHDLIYKAYFVDAKNVGEQEVLLQLVEKAGLDVTAARDALEKRLFKDAVDADWEKSRRYGVTGVPTFVSRGYGVVGAQPYEALEKLVIEAGAERSSEHSSE